MSDNLNDVKTREYQQRVLSLRADYTNGLDQIINEALQENIPVALIVGDKNSLPNAWGYWGQKNASDGTPEQLMTVQVEDTLSAQPFKHVRVMFDDLEVPFALDLPNPASLA